MVNPDVDGYTKAPNQGKILRKTQKDDNLLKPNKKNTETEMRA